MAGTDRLTKAQRVALESAIRAAERECRFEISVYFGHIGEIETRDLAERMHAALASPSHSILLLVDTETRAIEIVTGAEARRHLTDEECAAAIRDMAGALADGDLVGGLTLGIAHLGEYADPTPAA